MKKILLQIKMRFPMQVILILKIKMDLKIMKQKLWNYLKQLKNLQNKYKKNLKVK